MYGFSVSAIVLVLSKTSNAEFVKSDLSTRASDCEQSTFTYTSVATISETECSVLVDLYRQTDGENWKYNSNWLSTLNSCGWIGITFHRDEIDVTEVKLRFDSLRGMTPKSLRNLSVEQLSLRQNSSGLRGFSVTEGITIER